MINFGLLIQRFVLETFVLDDWERKKKWKSTFIWWNKWRYIIWWSRRTGTIKFLQELTKNICKTFRFHRIVQNGRSIAVDLIKKHAHLGDGTFLVRPSETFVGAYSLSFLRKGEFEKPAFSLILQIWQSK